MEQLKISRKTINEWIILRTIALIFLMGISIGIIFGLENGLSEAQLTNLQFFAIRLCSYSLIVIILGIMIIYAYVFPYLQYKRYFYSVSNQRIEIIYGVIFKRHKIIPFVRLQHVEVFRGILDRFFGLSSVTIFTAGSFVRLPNLSISDAEKLVSQLRVYMNELKITEEIND